jgi:hypothetical protein
VLQVRLQQPESTQSKVATGRGQLAHCLHVPSLRQIKCKYLRQIICKTTDSYFEALEGYLEAHGCPVAFYSDKHTVFRVGRQNTKGGAGMTQFGRALAELNIEILCANSSQAKGRVELSSAPIARCRIDS